MPEPVFDHDRERLNGGLTLDEGEIRRDCHAIADTIVLFGPWRLIFPMQCLAGNEDRSGWVIVNDYDGVENEGVKYPEKVSRATSEVVLNVDSDCVNLCQVLENTEYRPAILGVLPRVCCRFRRSGRKENGWSRA